MKLTDSATSITIKPIFNQRSFSPMRVLFVPCMYCPTSVERDVDDFQTVVRLHIE
jgi:hypothetical protein